MSNLTKARQLVKPNEGLRLEVYDDETAQPIRPGDRLEGHPSIGRGRALDYVHGITEQEADYLFGHDLQDAIHDLRDQHFSFWPDLSEWRQAVLIDMTFNMGIGKLLGFKKMLSALMTGNTDEAARQIEDSHYFRELATQKGSARPKQNYCIMMFNQYYSDSEAEAYFNQR